MIKSSYEVEVLVNGKPLREYVHNGKLYIEGREETKFSLRLRNNSGQRKLFVPSIDGLSVMDGKDASFDSSGYIVRPYSSVTIDGWRTSAKEVAEFFFSSPDDSYANKKGKGGNLGIIGVAVFGEKMKPVVPFNDPRDVYPQIFPKQKWVFPNTDWTEFLLDGRRTALTPSSDAQWMLNSLATSSDGSIKAMCASSSGEVRSYSNSSLGTGWGDQKQSEVTMVDFDSEDAPREVFEINYNTRDQLEKMGISFRKEPVYVSPQAFPGQFCEPPKK